MGDGEEVAHGVGQILVDRRVAEDRTRAMEKRDLALLAAAYKAIGSIRDAPFEDQSAGLQALIDNIDGPGAPANIRDLATSGTALKAYASHRVCSSMVHPGVGIKSALMPRDRLEAMTDEVAYICLATADATLRALAQPR
jgi:hypothetical protein